MAKKNDDFFKKKKVWSEVKDDVLGCYFKPYVQKILHTNRPLIYVDCFAGKGKFEDGKRGSPMIALDIIGECVESSTMPSVDIRSNFIDLNYAADLQENLKNYPNVSVFSGRYEDLIWDILNGKRNCNVFLYIDPYGIKALDYHFFEEFSRRDFYSIELLINMNSFGFIREACSALGTRFEDAEIFDDLVEYDSSHFVASEKSIKDLNNIAGGIYWQTIIEDFKAGRIDGYEAEKRFADEYCKRLGKNYTFVLNMPLRIQRGQRPKYRLIHATNHRDGCLLMVDNIYNRWQALRVNIQQHGQMSLFNETMENEDIDMHDLDEKVRSFFSQIKQWKSLHEALAYFFVEYGAICSTGDVKKILKKCEQSGELLIVRNPATTENGKPSTFMNEGKGRSVSIRWIK